MRDLLRNVFGGRPAEAVQCLLDSTRLDEEELEQIRQAIQNATAEIAGENAMNAIVDVLSGPAWQHLALALLHTLWQGLAAAGRLWLLLRRIPARSAGKPATGRAFGGVVGPGVLRAGDLVGVGFRLA